LSKKNDTKWFIEKAKLIHGGNFDYSKSVYINAKENIEIKCFKHNQTFYQTSNNHFNSKYPCEKCKKQHRRRLYADGIDKFIKKMSSKFGDAFDYSNTNYINAKTKVQLICKKCKAEIFSDPYVLLNGKGCPACYQNKSKTEFKIKKLKEINDFVRKLGGKCLNKDYFNNEEDLKFECKKGHVFYESWADVKFSMRWCKECAPNRYVGETLTRMILEHLLSTSMPSSYLKSMGGLQLDGYCKKRKLAFEYQGYQHYTKGSYFHNNAEKYKNQQARDSQKKLLCKENGITLIEVFEFKTIRKSRVSIFVEEVKTLLNNLGIEYTKAPFIIDLERLYRGRESGLYEIAKLVVEKENATIQDYIGSESNHIVICKKGHKTSKKLSVLKRNGFNCSVCDNINKYLNLKNTIEQRGGALIDQKLKKSGFSNVYSWVCEKGHKSKTKGQYLVNGHWCKACQYEEKKHQIDTDLFIEIASDSSLTTSEKLKKLNVSSGVFYSRLQESNIKNIHSPQDRSIQDVSSKSKGEIYQLDPISLKIIKKYKYLEAVRKESKGKFKPEGVRGQMKKNKKAYGFYWIRAKDYENYLRVNLKE